VNMDKIRSTTRAKMSRLERHRGRL
jgi:hypothetical protein